MNINVKDFLGENYSIEDAIILRDVIKNNMEAGVTLDFAGLKKVPSTFLTTLFAELINSVGRDIIFNAIDVKNLTNYTDYSRVVLGTTFAS